MYQPHQSMIKKVKALVEQHGGWRHVFDKYPSLQDAISKYPRQTPCPRTGEGRTVFRLVSGWENSGQAFHNREGRLTDGLNVISFILGCNVKQAAEEVLAITGGDLGHINNYQVIRTIAKDKNPEYCSKEKSESRYEALTKLIQESIPLQDSPIALNYLKSRGIILDELEIDELSSTLGFHSGLSYWCNEKLRFTGKYPALLGLFSDKNGQNLTIHRIYLNRDGTGKAAVSEPKKLMSPPNFMGGGAFRLGQMIKLKDGTYCIGVAEGIETALAVRSATRLPCWACYSDSVLAQFEPPEGVSIVIIWMDRDSNKAGEIAAAKLAQRLKDKGIKIKYMYPNHLPHLKKEDWLDVLVEAPDKFPLYIAR